MKKQNKLTFASMIMVTGAVIGLAGCGEEETLPIQPLYGNPPVEYTDEETVTAPINPVYGPPEFFLEEEDDAPLGGAVDESGTLYEYYSKDGSVLIRQDFSTYTSVIIDGEEAIPVDIAMGIYGPRIEKTDIDGDGEDEYLIAECEGSGTGMSVYGLCIVNKDGDEYFTSTYDGKYFADYIREHVEYSYDPTTHEITVAAQNPDKTVVVYTKVIERSYSEEYELTDVVWSDIIRISLIDGKPYLSAPSGYIFADTPMPDYEDAVAVYVPILVDENSCIEFGEFILADDIGSKTP